MKHKKAKPDEITERMKVLILLTVEDLRKRAAAATTREELSWYIGDINRMVQDYKTLVAMDKQEPRS